MLKKKELVLLVKTDKKTNQTSTTVFTSLYPAIRVMNQAAKELLKKTTCKFGKNCFSTDDVKYQVIELGDISWDRYWDEMSFEQEITERKVLDYGAVVQISKYRELNWTYISADDDLWNTGCESPADYYIKFCEDYPDFTYKDYRWENIQDDGKQFELYHKDELLLTIYFVGGNNCSPVSDGRSIYREDVPKLEAFEKFAEKYTGKAESKMVEDVNKKSRWFIKRMKHSECDKFFGFPSFKDAKIALRDLKKLYRKKVGKGVMLEDNAVYAPNDVMFVIWPNDSYKPKQEDNEKFVVNNVGKSESQAVNYKN